MILSTDGPFIGDQLVDGEARELLFVIEILTGRCGHDRRRRRCKEKVEYTHIAADFGLINAALKPEVSPGRKFHIQRDTCDLMIGGRDGVAERLRDQRAKILAEAGKL